MQALFANFIFSRRNIRDMGFGNNIVDTKQTKRRIMNDYQKVIYKKNYARWNGERREEWAESVDRYAEHMLTHVPAKHREEYLKAIGVVKRMGIVPSMRGMWTAGKALEKSNIGLYGCSYLAITKPLDFAEMMYILMHGTGVGFNVDFPHIEKLPQIPKTLIYDHVNIITVRDSKRGWFDAMKQWTEEAFSGTIHDVDYSQIRPEGAILRTFGGRASGAQPLIELVQFFTETIESC